MRFIYKLCLSALLASVAVAAAQAPSIDPSSQIQWNLDSGTTLPASCTQNGQYAAFPYGAQWGQSFTLTTTSVTYVCSPTGWVPGAGSGTGTVIAEPQYLLPCYTLAGSAATIGNCGNNPTTDASGDLSVTGTAMANALNGGVNGGLSTLTGPGALKQDARLVTDVGITAGTGVITSATANFTSADNSRYAIINPKDALYVVTINAAGTGWNPNDRCAVAGGNGGQVIVLATNGSGVPTNVETIQSGYGYAAATAAACTAVSPATGTALTVNTTVNLGARSYTGRLTVTNSTTATLSSLPYGGANSTNASMILGTDDGPALNALIQTIPSDGAKGDLSLGCKPIITTVTIHLGPSKNTNIKGCGSGSGITAGLGAGAASGTTIIWAGAAHPVTTSVSSGHTVTLTDPLGHGFNAPSNCASSPRQCAVDLQGCAQAGLIGQHMVVTPVSSSTTLSFYTASTTLSTDSCYIPANATGGDIIQVDSEWGTTIENLNIQGSDQPSTHPRACIDLVDGSGSTTNGLNKVSNVFCGNLGIQGFAMPGNAFGNTSTAQFGVLASDLSTVNDKNNFENVSFYNVGACIAAEHQQPQDWTFSGTTYCAFSGDGFLLLDGNWWHAPGTVQMLQNGQDFVLGNFAHLDVGKLTEETDGPAFISGIQLGGPGDAIGSSMLAEFVSPSVSGLVGGILAIDHGVYPATGALPSNGDFVWASLGTNAALFLNDFTLTTGQLSTPTVTPLIDFSVASGAQKNVVMCHNCGGIHSNNVNATSTGNQNQTTVVCFDEPNGGGVGESGCNWLVHGDAAGVDFFRSDLMKIRALGGKVQIPQLGVPVSPSNPTCAVSGSTTYYYKFTAVSGGLETTPSSEYTASSCASSVSSTNYIQGIVWSVAGADSYNIYRGTSSGAELFAFNFPANTGYNTNLNPSGGIPFTFRDTTVTPAGALPTVNSTGELQVAYVLPILSTVTLGNACPINGVVWTGKDGSTGICLSNVLAQWPVPGTVTPATFTITAGTGMGSGGSFVAPACYTGSGQRCNVTGGTVSLTAGSVGLSGSQVLVFTFTNPGHAYTCVFNGLSSSAQTLNPFMGAVSGTVLYMSTVTAPTLNTQYFFAYVCGATP